MSDVRMLTVFLFDRLGKPRAVRDIEVDVYNRPEIIQFKGGWYVMDGDLPQNYHAVEQPFLIETTDAADELSRLKFPDITGQ